ncbi:MAG: ABC transporter permease, partial [Hyphomonadaceae bacterium]|nr:ABC transporter permease [Hyphomonadaceae bacterium]
IVFFLLTFGSVTVDFIQIGAAGNVHVNSPYAIINTMAIMAIFCQFAVVAFVANIVIRDDETGFAPMIRATQISKFDYLFGRFVGAFIASTIIMLAIPLAMMIGSFMPWLDPEELGPTVPWHYAYAFFVAGLPTLFLCAAMFFALATVTRSMMATYLGVITFFILYFVMSSLFSRPEYEDAVTLLEPYGIGALLETTEYWTASDRNTLVPPLSGSYFANRAIWLGVAIASLVAAYFLFSFSARGSKKKQKEEKLAPAAVVAAASVPVARQRFDAGAAWTQTWKRARFEFAYLFRSPAFIVLMALGLLNAGGALWVSTEQDGVITYPVTRLFAQLLSGTFTIAPLLIAIYYGGELVWRDRERRIHEIVDSTPAPDWSFVAPKVLALFFALFSVMLVGLGTAMLIQTLKGYTDFELEKYVYWYLLPNLASCFGLAALSVFLQAISPHKFVGWGLMLLYMIATLTFALMGFDHNLYLYGGVPGMPTSDMNVGGHYWIAPAWFQAYWTIGALILVVLAYLLWRRGADTRIMPRLRAMPRRVAQGGGAVLAALVLAFAGIGGWIFYNTNVLNDYQSNVANERWLAAMERELIQFEDTPQPTITDVTLNVDLRPRQHTFAATGVYVIENRTGAPLAEVHLSWPRLIDIDSVEIDGATIGRDYMAEPAAYPYQIWRFTTPMAPGERREIRFTTADRRTGFTNTNALANVQNNGTFLNNFAFTPSFGFSRAATLQDRNIRRRNNLPTDLRMPTLEEDDARRFHYLRHDSDWVNADITVTTDAGQTPIAPGYVVSDETNGDRRTVRFRTDAPIMHFFSIQSADYAIAQGRWNEVDLQIYYHPEHAYNIDRMMRAMEVSLETFSREFSPFQFRQMRILEFPGYARFAQSFANTVPYSEDIGFINRFEEGDDALSDRIDLVTYVTAHEVAHQWWAHQLIGADMQGSTMLSETFAQYSALLVMEEMYGPDQVRRFLRYELDRYLRSRGSEAIEEVPLMRVENQPYIHYRKGALVMYFLRNEVGEEVVNRALRRLLEQFAFRGAPYPRSLDFVTILREEAGPEHAQLIEDLFERITLYDARVTAASATQNEQGTWDVVLTVEAQKFYADGEGRETETPLNEQFEFGVFTAEPGRGAFSSDDVLVFERRPVASGSQEIRFTVAEEPRYVGIDPYNKRIDRDSSDNVLAVTIER